MGLFGRIFGKQTAKVGLAMHIRSAKYYAKRSKRTARATRAAYNTQQKLVLDLEQAMRESPISLKKIVETTNKFIQSCSDEAKELYKISGDAFTLEYKIVKELSKLIKDMDDVQSSIKSNPNVFTGDAEKDISELNSLFSKIKGQITLEKRQMKDLKRNKEKMRDRSWKTDDMLLNSLKRSARKEKRKVKKTDDVLDELHKLINHIKEVPTKPAEMPQSNQKEQLKKVAHYADLNKKLNDNLPKLKAEITNLKDDIEDELTFLARILTAEVVLMERMKELNQENIEKIKLLRNQGFPKKAFDLIENKQQEFLNFLKHNELRALNNAKALSSMVD
ncbi:hypothetical protein KY313_01170 [Candidatus Woesearchaeota archaeon]|jgi:hypothetical protein|nr:hypothetical protein [Candidatus Woesearchaeota archaeon]